jgi:hypothetical protein
MRLSMLLLPLNCLVLAALSACSDSADASGKPAASSVAKSEFALYALSRGKGVPEPTRNAFDKAHTLLAGAQQRGEVVKLTETRIGLEGETKLCVEAKTAPASRKLQSEVRRIAKGVDLFNVVEESCSKK